MMLEFIFDGETARSAKNTSAGRLATSFPPTLITTGPGGWDERRGCGKEKHVSVCVCVCVR